MDEKIKKIVKEEKKVVKDTRGLLKADKKMDAKMERMEKREMDKKKKK